MTDEAYLRRKWFGGRDTEHLTFTEAVELTMEKKYAWKSLTDAERTEVWWSMDMSGMPEHDYGKAIEAKLKERNQ